MNTLKERTFMQINVTQSGESARIAVSGEVDELGSQELKRRFSEVRFSEGVSVVFDFDGVTHIVSAGLGKLLLFYKTIASHGGSMRIERVPAAIFDLLQQLKLDTVFSITKK
jgi:anti-sigma B factor antagonist